jgi:hypothetical protein
VQRAIDHLQTNGGYAGAIPYSAIAPGVSLGYATVGTDTGHVGTSSYDASFALGHPEKIIDFGYRAIHQPTTMHTAINCAPIHLFLIRASSHSFV